MNFLCSCICETDPGKRTISTEKNGCLLDSRRMLLYNKIIIFGIVCCLIICSTSGRYYEEKNRVLVEHSVYVISMHHAFGACHG